MTAHHWRKTPPTQEGWYWVKYRGRRSKVVVCPAEVHLFEDGAVVQTARGDTFCNGEHHGGAGFSCRGIADKSFRFGPRVQPPTTE